MLPESLALHASLMDPAPTNLSCAKPAECETEVRMQRFKRARSKPSYTHPNKSCPLWAGVLCNRTVAVNALSYTTTTTTITPTSTGGTSGGAACCTLLLK